MTKPRNVIRVVDDAVEEVPLPDPRDADMLDVTTRAGYVSEERYRRGLQTAYELGVRDAKAALPLIAVVAAVVGGILATFVIAGIALAATPRPVLDFASPDRGPAEAPGELSRPSHDGTAAMTPASTSPSATIGTGPASLEAATDPDPSVATDHGLEGDASHMGPGYGRSYLALPWGPGVRVRICGPAACVVQTSTDAGPALFMQRRGRVADLSDAVFAQLCGCSAAIGESPGLIPVTVERIGRRQVTRPTLPPTDLP